jgi:acyl carrier protein
MALIGPYLSPGYHGDEQLTARRYGSIGTTASARRWLRTGDLARRLPDGQLLHVGRADLQVKIRGIRIEPGEIEAALRQCAGVREAVVLAREIPAGADEQMELAAWVTGTAKDVAAVRRYLRDRLPVYMIPMHVTLLAELPRLPNGKVDLRALRSAPLHADALGETDTALTETEARLTLLWRELLGRDTVRIEDDFFALGGHSLLATRLIARVRDVFGVEVPLAGIFEHTTLGAFAACLDQCRDGATAALPVIARRPRPAVGGRP